jgi:competence ComEA-like helix-hairpin-helix protein
MKTTHWVKDYFSFSRKDSIAVLVITALIVGVFFIPLMVKSTPGTSPATDTAWIAAIKTLEVKDTAAEQGNYQPEKNTGTFGFEKNYTEHQFSAAGQLFYFDPNSLSADGWKKLGLRDKTIHTILNYLSKGGHFRKPDDLQRIYGLFPNEYERIAPYIQITAATEPADKPVPGYKPVINERSYTRANGNAYAIVDINTADTSNLVPLPGIGGKLAARILNFRDKLGGFYSVSQVGETYGLPDSVFQKIKRFFKADANAVKKININTATLEELKAHPYLRWAIANSIVAYRNEHGPFTKLEDIKKVIVVTDAIYNKIIPYLNL